LRKAIGGTGLGRATITNTGTLEGGNLSAAIGLVGTSPWIATIINSGVISAGDGGDTAIDMGTSASSQLTLELQDGSLINGNVIASGSTTDIVRLGSTINSTLDATQIGATAKYRNFELFEKTDSGKTNSNSVLAKVAMESVGKDRPDMAVISTGSCSPARARVCSASGPNASS
jgi:hypothetical protein